MPSDIPDSYAGPGLFDLQMNGYAGFDFNGDWRQWSAGQLHEVRAALGARGVVRALPTLITDDADELVGRAGAYARLLDADAGLQRVFPGLHVEGPFISADDGPRGAHPLAFCREPAALPDLLDRLVDASGGRIKMLTLAPELDGALRLIERACEMGIVVALGHTCAGAEILAEAVSAGARVSTHLGNGSHQTLPRLDNYVQRQLADDRLAATFIADGHHIPYPTLQNFIRAKTLERSLLVTDAMAAAGCGPGSYQLGRETVVVDEDLRCQIPGQPNLAGSALTLDRAVLNVAGHCGVTFAQAWAMASTGPANLIGMPVHEQVHVRIDRNGFNRIKG